MKNAEYNKNQSHFYHFLAFKGLKLFSSEKNKNFSESNLRLLILNNILGEHFFVRIFYFFQNFVFRKKFVIL
jgi:hypothetical protein